MGCSSCTWSRFSRHWSFPYLCVAAGSLCGFLIMRPSDDSGVMCWGGSCLPLTSNCSRVPAAAAPRVTTTQQPAARSTSFNVITKPASTSTTSKPKPAGYTKKSSTIKRTPPEKKKVGFLYTLFTSVDNRSNSWALR
jgi:hypothetical protein